MRARPALHALFLPKIRFELFPMHVHEVASKLLPFECLQVIIIAMCAQTGLSHVGIAQCELANNPPADV